MRRLIGVKIDGLSHVRVGRTRAKRAQSPAPIHHIVDTMVWHGPVRVLLAAPMLPLVEPSEQQRQSMPTARAPV